MHEFTFDAQMSVWGTLLQMRYIKWRNNANIETAAKDTWGKQSTFLAESWLRMIA